MTTAPFTNTLSTLLTDPVRNFKFLVTFSPKNTDNNWPESFGKMGFVSLSGLSITTEPIAYREGGYNTNVHQIPGQTAFTPISLAKGVMLGQDANPKWMKRLFSVLTPSATSGIGADFRCNMDIQVLSHPNPAGLNGSNDTTAPASALDQHTSMRFRVYNTWISSLSYSNLDAGANSLMVEEMSIVHEGFDVIYGTGMTVAQSAAEFTI
jgi:phage tail-like protein